jgi:hypothetical protein
MPEDDMPGGDMPEGDWSESDWPESDWPEIVDTIIKPYPLELSMIMLVLKGLEFDGSTDSSDSSQGE